MDRGSIIELGTHEGLLAQGGVYTKLGATQAVAEAKTKPRNDSLATTTERSISPGLDEKELETKLEVEVRYTGLFGGELM